mgnify:CR=1 FL=1
MRANAEARFKKKVKKIMFSTPGSLISFSSIFRLLFFVLFTPPSLSPPARRQWTSSFVPFEILKLL